MAINKILNGITVGNTTKFNHNTMAPEVVYYIDDNTNTGKIPAGGYTNQVATKNSSADYDIIWKTLTADDIQGVVSTNNVLTKTNTETYIPSQPYHPATKLYVDTKLTQNVGNVCYGGIFDPNTGICTLYDNQIYDINGEIITTFTIAKDNAARVKGYYFISSSTGNLIDIDNFYPGDWCISNGADGWSKLSQSGTSAGESLITGVKGDNEPVYRIGDVNLTAENIGAVKAQPDISAGTACKVTFNKQGLITSSSNLSINDIPDLSKTYLSLSLGNTAANKNIITDSQGNITLQDITNIPFELFTSFKVDNTLLSAKSNNDTLTFVAGNNIILTPNTNDNSIIISSTITDIPELSDYYLPKATTELNKMLITDNTGLTTYAAQPVYLTSYLPSTDISTTSFYNLRGNLYYYGEHRRQVQVNDQISYLNITIPQDYYARNTKTEKDIIIESDTCIYYSIVDNNYVYIYEEHKQGNTNIIYQATTTGTIITHSSNITYEYTNTQPIISFVNVFHPAYTYFNTVLNEWQYILTDQDCFKISDDIFDDNTGGVVEETDPTVADHIKNITIADINSWNNKQDKIILDSTPIANSTNLLTSGSIYTALQSKANITDLNNKADKTTVDTKADKTNVLTKNNTTAYTPTDVYHPTTKKYVDNSIANIQIPDISNLATKDYVNNAISNINLTPYAKKTDLNAYALKTDLNSYVKTTDLTTYAQKTYVDNAIANIPKTDLTNYATITYVNTQTSTKANQSDVLTKTNTGAFTPTGDYHPATKKYVDSLILASLAKTY